jgi:SNF2 family DNA or RNA helicase
VALGDGSVGLVPSDWLRGFPLLAFAAARGEGGHGLQFRRSQASLLATWLRGLESGAVRTDEAFERARVQCEELAARIPVEPPSTFRGTLRDYQKDALGWLQGLHRVGAGGVLADDMGLGKTVQILAYLETRRAQGAGPLLVVAPRSVVHQWREEAARFTPELSSVEHWGPARATDPEAFLAGTLYVTSYGTLRRDFELLADVPLDTVVFDEAHTLKNPASQTFHAARALNATTRLALTGTPIENSLGDLWALSEVLNPGMLGGRETYIRLVASSSQPDPEGPRWDLAGPLRRLVAPFLLRRTKAEVLTSLPPRTEQTVLLTPTGEEARRYDTLRQVAYDEVIERRSTKLGLVALEALLRLRQEACHPGLLDPSRRGEPSTKVDALVERLQELAAEGYQALVFSQFTKLLAIVRERLDAAGIAYEYLDGRVRDRATPVRRFQEDRSRTAFLISLKAGGAGLNLTAADFVFLLDPWWNPAVEAQAIDRAHRMGRTRPVFAYRLVVRGTIEEKVLALQAHKRELADAILAADDSAEEGAALQSGLTEADLAALLAH